MPSAITPRVSLDPLIILPPEIWQFILAVACNGSMAAVLPLTMISPRWHQALTESSLLWRNIRFDGSDEDSLATIALFLHLSKRSPLFLQISVPISPQFDLLCVLLGPHQDRIREIVLQPGKWANGPDRGSRHTVSDREYFCALEQILHGIGSLPSLKSLDVVSNRPIRVGTRWTPPLSVSSTGNWLIPLAKMTRFLVNKDTWGHLTIHANDLIGASSQFSRIEGIEHLCIYSNEYDPQESQLKSVESPIAFAVPKVQSLGYRGLMDWASIQLITAASHTIRSIDLCVSIHDLDHVITALGHATALRSFKLEILAVDPALAARPRQRVQLPMSTKNWVSRITRTASEPGDFKCEMPIGSDERSLETLWKCFHHVFPVAQSLTHNPRIEFGTLRVLRDKSQLQTASLTTVSPPTNKNVDDSLRLRIPGPVTETMIAEAMIIDAMTSIRRLRVSSYMMATASQPPIKRPEYSISAVSQDPVGTLRFHWGEPIPIIWRSPLDHSRRDWVGIYQDGVNSSSLVTDVIALRWVPVHDEEWDGDIPLPVRKHLEDERVECGELTFRGFTLPFETGEYELRYHIDGGYEVVASIRHIQVYLERPVSFTYACIRDWLRRIVCLALESDINLIPRAAMPSSTDHMSVISSSADSFIPESPPASPSHLHRATSPTSPFTTEGSFSSDTPGSPSTKNHDYQDESFRFWTGNGGKKIARQARRIAWAVEEALDIELTPEFIMGCTNVKSLTRHILKSLQRKRKTASKGNSANTAHFTGRSKEKRGMRGGPPDLVLSKGPFR